MRKVKNVIINRPQHILKKNHVTQIMHNILFVDTETNVIQISETEQKHVFRLGCGIFYRYRDGEYVEENRFSSTNLEEFWKHILKCCRKKITLHIFAHNMHFDFNVLQSLKYMGMNGFSMKGIVIDSNRFIAKFYNKYKDYRITFVDSTNYMMISIAALGKLFGIEKMHVDFEKSSIEEITTYCFRDVEILAKWIITLIKFVQVEDLGKFRYTIASQAFAAYKHRFMKHDIVAHSNEDVVELELSSYRGGLCDCFRVGKYEGEEIYKLDVNSMYPYVMKTYAYPIRFVGYYRYVPLQTYQERFKDRMHIADVTINIKRNWIPIKFNNKLCRVRGRVRACLTSAELIYYKDDIEIEKIHAIAVYESAQIFTEYVNYFYEKKEEASRKNDNVHKMLYKLFLNSLYGKFAQCVREIQIREMQEQDTNAATLMTYSAAGEKYIYRFIDRYMIEEGDRMLGYDSMPAIASFVTAYARVYLHELIKTAGEENVFYVDTDSLVVTKQGLQRLQQYIDEYELGKLKVEQVANKLEIVMPKQYTFGQVKKMKGIRKDAKKVNDNTYQQYHFMKTKSLWRKGISDAVIVKTITKHLNSIYDKGIVEDDGRVTPYTLDGEVK